VHVDDDDQVVLRGCFPSDSELVQMMQEMLQTQSDSYVLETHFRDEPDKHRS